MTDKPDYKGFAIEVLRQLMFFSVPDGCDLQESGIEFNILRDVKFDPEIHPDPDDGFEKGDPYFEIVGFGDG